MKLMEIGRKKSPSEDPWFHLRGLWVKVTFLKIIFSPVMRTADRLQTCQEALGVWIMTRLPDECECRADPDNPN